MPALRSVFRHALSPLLPALLLAVACAFSGCASPPPPYRTAHDFAAASSSLRSIAVLPLDVEVSELSAGGVTEKRDDWTELVTANLQDALDRLTDARPLTDPAALPAEAWTQLRGLHRAIIGNQFIHGFYGPGILDSIHGPLRYEMGSLEPLAEATGADAFLFVFVRDDYATGGRKAVVALGIIAGIPVRGGVTISSAALVGRDGRLLWMNQVGALTGDLRTQKGADEAIVALCNGLPRSSPPQ